MPVNPPLGRLRQKGQRIPGYPGACGGGRKEEEKEVKEEDDDDDDDDDYDDDDRADSGLDVVLHVSGPNLN